MRWFSAKTLAIHPDGKRILALIPLPADPVLRLRPAHGQPERRFRLQWISLESGEAQQSKELAFRRGELFGFEFSPAGNTLCTIAEGKVLVLDIALQAVAQLDSQVRNAKGETFNGSRCGFFPDSTELLILFQRFLTPWNAGAMLQTFDWQRRKVSAVVSFPQYASDTIPLSCNRLLMINPELGWRFRHRIAEVALDGHPRKAFWKAFSGEEGPLFLIASPTFVFRVERVFNIPDDVLTLYWDRRTYPDDEDDIGLKPYPSSGFIGRIRSWKRGTGKKGPEFAQEGYDLVWPTAVSSDERWLATRAFHFDHMDMGQTLWDDNRFVIFDIGAPKKPIFVSENFGPEEMITGLAFTPDRKTLVVATSRRLLIYDVKETAPSR